MVHIGTSLIVNSAQHVTTFVGGTAGLAQTVLVVRDSDRGDDYLDAICEFLDIGVERVSSGDDLAPMLRALRPMAVIADVDGEAQDGFHVMKIDRGV